MKKEISIFGENNSFARVTINGQQAFNGYGARQGEDSSAMQNVEKLLSIEARIIIAEGRYSSCRKCGRWSDYLALHQGLVLKLRLHAFSERDIDSSLVDTLQVETYAVGLPCEKIKFLSMEEVDDDFSNSQILQYRFDEGEITFLEALNIPNVSLDIRALWLGEDPPPREKVSSKDLNDMVYVREYTFADLFKEACEG